MALQYKRRVAAFAALGLVALTAAGLTLPGMLRGPSGPPQKDLTIGSAQRTEAIEHAIAKLNAHYVSADAAALVEKRLRAQLQRGDFDSATSAIAFARALTDALQRETHDRHLEVRYVERATVEPAPGQEDSPDDNAAEFLQQRRMNFGFAGFTRLRGNIGLIDLRSFGRPQGAARRIAAMMELAVDTGALIVDLRRCSGGDPETVMLFASYLFDQPTHLNDIYWRDENRTEERWTTADVAGTHYGQSRKVYLLTSSDTFSGCEDFSYALKYSRRATLVGETTGGGAHAGDPQWIGEHFMMFVPAGRPINPVTKTDWESVGVVPDIKASADDALDVAQIALLGELVAAEKDPDWKRRLGERLEELK